jgi:hypothetical protein
VSSLVNIVNTEDGKIIAMGEPTRQVNDFMIAAGIGGQQRDGSQLLDSSLLRAAL